MTATLERTISPFKNEPVKNFTDPADVVAMQEALRSVQSDFGKKYHIVIDGECLETEKYIASINPANPDEVIGLVGSASLEQATRAIEAAAKSFETWKHTRAKERAGIIFKAAELVRRRRMEFNAFLVYEVGKSWSEADGDTAEAIDFLEFYAREALRYDGPQPVVPMEGEANELRYIPLGVGVIIPPWNFAFAIMAGITTAAIVAGNTAVLKPSSDAPVIAAKFVELLDEAGLPAGVLNFVPGSGGTIGDAIVSHPLTRFISFTGSKEVGLHINELAAKTQPGQKWIKRVVAEMGGKDSIIVADDADVDAAVEGVAVSAFGFQGQKCSACSRAIVDEEIYDEFVAKLKKRVERITVGDPAAQNNYMGPVVNESALKSISQYIEVGKSEGNLLAGGSRVGDRGYFLQPTVIVDVPPDARISQEEIFGPVLAVIKAKDYDDALQIANNTEFGLTGAVYSKDDAKLDRAREEFFVGNLYLNRKCTGAMVGAHPFGGFNMSGTDSKAGSADYLLLFLQAKTIAKKVEKKDSGEAGKGF
ncbi:MAG: L-glutamate gamma-semialdehyde dehydrogenase [Candidatus Meridianibacter frigidus]|nr:MAG: L-glutamate gamma-semialdehyde dehydrogenase [Candidatus Eremiobacteraeota bacterium]